MSRGNSDKESYRIGQINNGKESYMRRIGQGYSDKGSYRLGQGVTKGAIE